MIFEEWEPIYSSIISDMGYSRMSDEASARLLKSLMLNADIMMESDLRIGEEVSVFGGSDDLWDDISRKEPAGTLISAGSATETLVINGIIPDIVVTDLDGDIESQLQASEMGAVTLIHAHGDNSELIMTYAKEFKGKVILTTQSVPDRILCNFGGFTDGDRAVCLARHFGARRINLYGFDYEHPSSKDGSDPAVKLRKLAWAKRIIESRTDDIVRI